jgi:hypothetical protein
MCDFDWVIVKWKARLLRISRRRISNQPSPQNEQVCVLNIETG